MGLEYVNLERIVMKRREFERTGLARIELERIEWEKDKVVNIWIFKIIYWKG